MKIAAIENARSRQEELGQFLTAMPVAGFMASMFGPLPNTVRLLDAGAGAGSLTAAFVSRCCEKRDGVRSIEATLYEIDGQILDSLTATMRECERRCTAAGIRFTFTIHPSDFIQEMSSRLAGDLFGTQPPAFDAAIANPPYRKISTDSAERRALRSVGVETSNLYTGFIALIQRLLVLGGQRVGITPRSFCNGPYFRPFREDFLSQLELRRLHVFESRKAAFREDSVLQENIIFHAVKGCRQPCEMIVSSSSGTQGDEIIETVFPFAEIVHPRDAEKFIHVPSTTGHARAKKTTDDLSASLASLGVTVSTGRVVDFRLKDALRKEPEQRLRAVTLSLSLQWRHRPLAEARSSQTQRHHGQCGDSPMARAFRHVSPHETLHLEGRAPPPRDLHIEFKTKCSTSGRCRVPLRRFRSVAAQGEHP